MLWFQIKCLKKKKSEQRTRNFKKYQHYIEVKGIIEGASATRYLNALLGKIELSIMSCRKHVFSSDYLPLTIEMSQEMNLKSVFKDFTKGPKSTFDVLCNNWPKSMKFVSSSHFIKLLTYN